MQYISVIACELIFFSGGQIHFCQIWQNYVCIRKDFPHCSTIRFVKICIINSANCGTVFHHKEPLHN